MKCSTHFNRNMVRKIKIVVISLLFIITIFIGTRVYATTGKVINNSTRIRKEASTDSSIVETIYDKETEVEILGDEDDWYKVKFEKYEGYIRKDLLEVEKENSDEEPSSSSEQEESSDENNETENKEEEKSDSENKEESEKEENKDEEVAEDTSNVNSKKTVIEKMEITVSDEVELKVLPLVFASSNSKVEKDSKITVIEILGNWCHIEESENEGWVLKSKLEELINEDEEESKENEVNQEEKEEEQQEEKQEEKEEEQKEKEEEQKEEKEEEQKEEEKEESKTTTKVEKTKYVSTSVLNVRQEPKSNSKVINQLDLNDKVTVTEEIDGKWSKITKSGKTGYVASEYLSDSKTEVTSRASQETRTETSENNESNNANDTKEEEKETKKDNEEKNETKSNDVKSSSNTKSEKEEPESKKEETKKEEKKESSSSKVSGADIVAYAKKFLGYKYVYGTAGPNTFDCSGFTSYVYKHFGYSLNRTSSGQRSNGTAVTSKDALKAGDIVCFSGHVGIYIGGGQFIHAANPRKGVIISSLSESYYKKTYITSRRILK